MSFLIGPFNQIAVDALKETRKQSPTWGVSIIVTTDWQQVRWRQRYTVRANDAAEALALVLLEHADKLPVLGALDNLATHTEPLCASDAPPGTASGKGGT